MFITSFSLTWSYLMDCGVEQEGKLNGGETDCTGCSPRVFNFAGWLTTHSQHCLLESWAKCVLPKEAAIISCRAGLHLGSLIFRLFRFCSGNICKWELTLFPSILLLLEWKYQWRKQNSPADWQVNYAVCVYPSWAPRCFWDSCTPGPVGCDTCLSRYVLMTLLYQAMSCCLTSAGSQDHIQWWG